MAPKQKEPKGASSQLQKPSEKDYTITDPRFTSFATDPRFRLPSKKHARTKVDKRFSRMFDDDEFTHTAKVDRYGRKLQTDHKKKALERLYEPEDDEEEEEDKVEQDVEVEDDDIVARELRKADSALHEEDDTSSSSEEEAEEEEEGEEELDEFEENPQIGAFPTAQASTSDVPLGEVTNRIAVVNLDWDNIRATDLMAVFSSFLPSGGRIEKVSVYMSEFGKERMEREELEGPPKELFAKKDKADEHLEDDDEEDSEDDVDEDAEDDLDDDEEDEAIKKSLLREDAGEEFDSAALRQYQLDRLRYYYAVILFSSPSAAHAVYEATDGTEYLSSANFIDLRFVPDDVEFDEKPRDEATSVPAGYKPNEFVTDALQHSKVKLTWDADDAERKEVIKRAFTGSRAEIGENDLKAYLGSDSSDDEEEEHYDNDASNKFIELQPSNPTPDNNDDSLKPSTKLSKKEAARQAMRAALGLPIDDESSSTTTATGTTTKKEKAPVGNIQITFTSGFSNPTTTDDPSTQKKTSIFENEPIPDETTAEAYVRKERERKARRREKAKAKREGRDLESETAPDSHGKKSNEDGDEKEDDEEDLGFNDPFFTEDLNTTSASAKKAKAKRTKAERLSLKAERDAEAKASAAQRKELELLMAEDPSTTNTTNTTNKSSSKTTKASQPTTRLEHFDMTSILKAEKAKIKSNKNKKGKYRSSSTSLDNNDGENGDANTRLQKDFDMPVADPRFSAVYESHEFAIDPSHPRFSATEGMRRVLEEGRKKKQKFNGGVGGDEGGDGGKKKGKRGLESHADGGDNGDNDNELRGLVEKVKKRIRTG